MKRLFDPALACAFGLAGVVASASAAARAEQASGPPLSPPAELSTPAERSSPQPAPSSEAPTAQRQSPPRFHRAPPGEPYRLSFGLAATLQLEMAPKLAPGATISAAFEINPGSVASPLWRLSLTHAERRGLAEPSGDASFAFTLPTLDACPLRLGPRAFGVRPCAYASLGQVVAWGSGARRNETRSLLYAAAGLATLLSWRVSDAFEVIADGRVGVPFRREEFAFGGAVFFKTPAPGFGLSLGAAWGFP